MQSLGKPAAGEWEAREDKSGYILRMTQERRAAQRAMVASIQENRKEHGKRN